MDGLRTIDFVVQSFGAPRFTTWIALTTGLIVEDERVVSRAVTVLAELTTPVLQELQQSVVWASDLAAPGLRDGDGRDEPPGQFAFPGARGAPALVMHAAYW